MALGLKRNQLLMVIIMMSGTFLAVLNLTVLSPALPSIMRDMNVDATTVQWLTSGYSLVEAIVIPLSAYLMGRFSTRQLFIGGFSLFVVGSILVTTAQAFWMMLLGRVLQATCTGFVMPMSGSLIMLVFPREKRGTAMGLVGLIIGFAPALGPAISGVLVDSIGWRAMFLIVTILAVAVVLLATFMLKNYEGFERSSFDAPSVALSSLGLLGVLYGLSTFASSGTPVLSIALIAMGAVLVAMFARRQLKLDTPILRVEVLRSRKYRTAVIVIFIIQAALVGGGVIIPIYIQQVLGLSATISGVALLPGAVLGAFMSMLAGRMFDRVGVRPLAITGGCLMLVGAGLMVFCTTSTPILFITFSNTIMSIGLQTVMTPTNTWGINSLENKVIQHGNALANTINQVGGSFGTAVLVSLTALAPLFVPNAAPVDQIMFGDLIAFWVQAVILAIDVLIIIVFVRNRKGEANKVYSPEKNEDVEDTVKGRPLVRVKDVMNTKTAYLPSSATIKDVLAMMSRSETSGLPLVDDDMKVKGFISDGDIVKYLGRQDSSIPEALSKGYLMLDNQNLRERLSSLIALNAMDICTKKVVCVDSSMPLDEACRRMVEQKVRKVPVVEDSKLVGSISQRNIIHVIAAKTESGDRSDW